MEEVFGREPVTYVQIDQDLCANEYGEAPCEAELGITGSRKCYKTRRTCQDRDNYALDSLTLTFTKRREDVGVDGLYVIPSLQSVSTVPTKLNPGGSGRDSGALGERASISITFVDHPHSDNVVDPYADERDYIATERGTFWSKWLARSPYYNNRELRIYEGYRGQSLDEMRSCTYIIDRVEGPDSSGRVRVRAKDILKLADDESAQAPRASQGELENDIDESQDSLTIIRYENESDYPAGGGTVRIEDEVVLYSSAAFSDNVCTLSGLTRGAENTEADEHDAEERVQLCLRYEEESVEDIVENLLVEYGSVPERYINIDAWRDEAAVWLNQYQLSTLIVEPTGVNTLVGELSEQCLFNIWWDEREKTIPLEAIKPPSGVVKLLDDDASILAGTTSLKAKPDERVSQIWIFYGVRDPTENLDEEKNYRRLRIRADTAAESDNEYGEQRIKKIYSRWLRTDAQILNATTRLLSRFRNNPRYMTIDVDAKDRDSWTGSVVDVRSRTVVDETGEARRTRWQVISAEEIEHGHTMRYNLEVYEYGVGERYGIWMNDDAPDYADAGDAERANGGWWANETSVIGEDDDEPYRWA